MQALSQLSYTPTRGADYSHAPREHGNVSAQLLLWGRSEWRSVRPGVVDHSLEIDHDCRFVADDPCIVAGRQ